MKIKSHSDSIGYYNMHHIALLTDFGFILFLFFIYVAVKQYVTIRLLNNL